MRVVAVAIWLSLLLAPFAEAEEMACRFYRSDNNSIEWVEQGEPRGMRIVARDPRWQIFGLSLEGTRHAGCPTCSRGEIAGAVLWVGTGANRPADIVRTLSLNGCDGHRWGFQGSSPRNRTLFRRMWAN